MVEKSFFLQSSLRNLQEKSHVIWEYLVVKGENEKMKVIFSFTERDG